MAFFHGGSQSTQGESVQSPFSFTFSSGSARSPADHHGRDADKKNRRFRQAHHNIGGTTASCSFGHTKSSSYSEFCSASVPASGKQESGKENGEAVTDKLFALAQPTHGIQCYFEGSKYSSSEKGEANQEPRLKPCTSLIPVSSILKGIPQSPHFLPLTNYSDFAKPALFIAWNRIFEETVDRIHDIRADGFWVSSRSIWVSLEELQNMGYNVLPLRRRLLDLTDLMSNLRQHKREIAELKSKAECHRMEKRKQEFEILKLKAMAVMEKAMFEYAMAEVEKMETEVLNFDGLFAELAIKPL